MSDPVTPTPTDQPGIEIFRLRVARGNGTSGSGDWRLYESRDQFEADVLSALIEAAANGKRAEFIRAARQWHVTVMRGGQEVGSEWTVQRFIAAEQLVDGEWVDLAPSLIEPAISWGLGAGR